VVAIGGKEILERKAKQMFGPKTTPQPPYDTMPRPAWHTGVELAMSSPARRVRRGDDEGELHDIV
jgi:hypothetical protein